VEQSGMSNGIKGLTEVQRDDHYIRVAPEQFCNRLENGYKSCSRGSSWTESILIRAAQVDGRLENCWINELLDNDTLECSAQDGSHRNRSKVRVFLWRSGLGNRCNRCQLPLLGNGRSSDRHIEQAGKRPTEDRSSDTQEPAVSPFQLLCCGVYPEFQTYEILLSAPLCLHDWRACALVLGIARIS